jgi:predicted neutral ceramidase superfamily lipid hydrolase
VSTINYLEKSLNEIFVGSGPALNPKTKKLIVKYLPWISLFLGLLTLLTAYNIWKWAHIVNVYASYTNSLSQLYGGPIASTNHMSIIICLSILILIIEATMFIAAFSATSAHKKVGWSLLLYVLLVNLAYGLVITFTEYGGFSSLLLSIVGSSIGLYFLFQIRKEYMSNIKKSKPVL